MTLRYLVSVITMVVFSVGDSKTDISTQHVDKEIASEHRNKEKTLFHLGGIINEVSGAVYDKQQNVIWSVGDSGDLVLGRTDMETNVTVRVPVVGKRIAREREELVMDNSGMLWILSTGDNHKERENVEINQVDPGSYLKTGDLQVLKTIVITYPQGAIDVEAAFVDGDQLYLIQKSFFRRSWIYTVDVSVSAPEIQKAKKYKKLKNNLARLITSACIDGRKDVFVLTYLGIYRLKNWQDAETVSARNVYFNPFFGQVETLVCDNRSFIVARESGRFWRILK